MVLLLGIYCTTTTRVILHGCSETYILTMALSQGAGTGAVGSFLLIAIQAMFFISSLHPSVPTSGQGGAIVDTTWHHCGMSTTFTTEHIGKLSLHLHVLNRPHS